MEEPVLIAARLALYISAGLLFGLAAFPLYGVSASERADVQPRAWTVGLAIAALASGALWTVALGASMAGTSLGELDSATIDAMLAMPSIWGPLAIRSVALVALITVTFVARQSAASAWITTALAASALASLAWMGHAAAGEGQLGALHLAADILHLLAAGAWLGAILALLRLAMKSRFRIDLLGAALTGFSTAGTVLVTVLLLTGLVNSAVLVGWSSIGRLPETGYGLLLIAKLVLFAGMLALAAINRLRLSPRIASHSSSDGATAIKVSLCAEIGLGITILALVAWMGMLQPPSAM